MMLADRRDAESESESHCSADADRVLRQPWVVALLEKAAAQPSVAPTGKSDLVDRAYREYCRRKNNGAPIDADDFCERHPTLDRQLAPLLEAHGFIEKHLELGKKKPLIPWPNPGEMLVGFQLLHELGRGGFARVFLAAEPALGNRLVVVKVSDNGSAEAHTLGRLGHANIVPVYSVKEDPGSGLTAVCMPYLGKATLCTLLERVRAPGVPLRARLILEASHDPDVEATATGRQRRSPLESCSYVAGIRSIGAQLAEALQFIHQRKIYHRDLKPSNVLLTPDGRPMLLDFNLCATARAAQERLGGTLPYMAPEQLVAVGDGNEAAAVEIDGRSDLFSLGVMLYELLTGRHPFGTFAPESSLEETAAILLARHQRGPLPVRQLNPQVDWQLARLVESCLAIDRDRRPQRAAELALALRQGSPPWRRAPRLLRSHPWLTAAVACLLFCLGGVAAGLSPQGADVSEQWRQGQEAYRERKFEAAVQHFTVVLDTVPTRLDALQARARALVKLGAADERYFHEALDDFYRVNALQPSGEMSAGRGYCMLRLKKRSVEQARHYFDEAIQQGFATAEVHNDLAYCLLLQKDRLAEAEKHLDASLSLQPRFQAALHNRAMLRFTQVVKKAGGEVPPTQQRGPTPATVQAEQQCRAWLQQANSDMRQGLELAPTSMELHRDACRLWTLSSAYDPNDKGEALQHLRNAVLAGCDPQALARESLLQRLQDDPAFKAILEISVPRQPMVPTGRIVDPMLD
jgi:eukaryotic-like serine/threonine-protein kinase